MSGNTRHLLVLWAFAGLMLVLVALQLGSALWRGQIWLAVLPLVLVGVLLAIVKLRTGDRQIRRLLRSESPEGLVAFYKRSIHTSLIPDGDAFLAQGCALAYALYGDYPAARAALQGIDWENRPPLVQGGGRSVEALLCYLASRQYEQGLELARSARELASVSGMFPGARTSAAAFESYVEIGQVLCGPPTDVIIRSLEQKMGVLPTLGRLLIAWGLATAYRKSGDEAKAEALDAYIHETAPHCRALVPPHTGVA